MHDLYIAEIYRPGTIFSSLVQAPEKPYIWSFKMIEAGTSRKCKWDFLFVSL